MKNKKNLFEKGVAFNEKFLKLWSVIVKPKSANVSECYPKNFSLYYSVVLCAQIDYSDSDIFYMFKL